MCIRDRNAREQARDAARRPSALESTPRLRRVHARLRRSPCMLVDPTKCPSAPKPMSVCVCVR
eukprot:1695330-Lingulodinium_polyedra.AAC.1